MEKNTEDLLFFGFLIAITIAIFRIRSYLFISPKKKSEASFVRRLELFIKENIISQKYDITLNDITLNDITLNDIKLPDIPNLQLYVEGRVIDQIDWYEHGCQVNKNRYLFVRMATLILSAIIPLLVLLKEVLCVDLKYVTAFSAILAAVITVLNGWSEIALFQSKYIEFRLVTEKLKSELALFLTSADHYNIKIENIDERKLKEAYKLPIDLSLDYRYILSKTNSILDPNTKSEADFNPEKMVEAIRIIQFKEFVSRIEAIINLDCYRWSESVIEKKKN